MSHGADASLVKLRYPRAFDEDLRRYSAEFTFACLVGRLRMYAGRPWRPALIRWEHANPGYDRDYAAAFGCPMVFGAGASALVVSGDTRRWTIPKADGRLRALLERSARHIEGALPADDTWAARVRTDLIGGLPEREARLEVVARRLKTSSRTLRRHLAREGTSFQQELDRVREQTATALMLRTDATVAEITDALGFTDVSAFTRAFRRWTGATPVAWRRAHR